MSEQKHITLVVGKKNKDIYQFHGDDLYQNLRTNNLGKVKPEDSVKWFNIPLVLNYMVMKNPLILDLIKTMGFQYEGLESHGTKEELKEAIKSL